jgi:hypothetical protein
MSEKMIFCLGEGRYVSSGAGYQKNLQIFNVSVTEDEYKKTKLALDVKSFKLPVAKWIDIKDIVSPTKEQKELGGYLKTLSYKDAWKDMWNGLSTDDKKFFGTLPHFSADIFEKITGIKYEIEKSLKGKTVKVEIDGESYSAIIQ